jgi:AbiU2
MLRNNTQMTDEQFLARWHLWITALDGREDSHSIVPQMEDLCWDMAVFEAIMASWKIESDDDGQNLKVNSVLFHFVVDTFIKSLCLDLRRITDPGVLVEAKSGKKDRSVYSIASLLKDIEAHREEYTRKRLFLACHLEYDVETLRKKHLDFVLSNPPGVVSALPRELNEGPSALAHDHWDRLCSCGPADRSPNNCIALDHLKRLEADVTAIRDKVEFVVNKHFAHAATPESRKSANNRNESITLAELIELVVQTGRLVNSVSALLNNAVFQFVAIAQFDKWDHWGKGWSASPGTLEEAWDRWEVRVRRLEPIFPDSGIPAG